jgi:hypothetical protein
MSQLTIQTQISGGGASRGGRRRPMRSERMVSLRSSLPVGLVTLRHDVPEYLEETTPKVDPAERAAETPVRKGGEAQW